MLEEKIIKKNDDPCELLFHIEYVNECEACAPKPPAPDNRKTDDDQGGSDQRQRDRPVGSDPFAGPSATRAGRWRGPP